jgi:hypothetical protein
MRILNNRWSREHQLRSHKERRDPSTDEENHDGEKVEEADSLMVSGA